MTVLLIVLILILFAVVAVQIGKVTELAAKIRGEAEMQEATNRKQGLYLLAFGVFFLIATIWSALHYKNSMLGYGPWKAASAHGGALDNLFGWTLFFTGIVFVITQILLFYFAYKYRGTRQGKAAFIAHDNKLEVIWTVIPAIVMTFLVISGLDAWNEVMADVSPDEDYLEFEATGYQFGWAVRYPGADGKLGEKNYTMITGINPLGQNWEDEKNLDDFHASEIYLPVGKKVRVRITSKDVLHNFYLPHFRVKMDAVPGMPTYFVFTPTKTTEEFRQELRSYPAYNEPADPTDPESPMRWEVFDYELACAELCGRGHYSMRLPVRVVSQDEFDQWAATQQSYYLSNIRGKDSDPWKDRLFDFEIESRKAEFNTKLEEALTSDNAASKTLRFDYVKFETGSAELTSNSHYELDNLVAALNKYLQLRVQLAGHTDNTGDEAANQELSEARAKAVHDYLVEQGVDGGRLSAVGYGSSRPVDSNETETGREMNRRTEFRILG